MTARKAILTAAEGPHAPMLDLALPTFEHYADRFGYDVVVGSGEEAVAAGRPGPWRKIVLLRETLERYDLVLWLDTDVMIVDAERDIADELGPDDYQGLVEQVSGDGWIPNTGVWLMRAGDRAQRFLDAVWNEVDWIDHMWSDQAAAVTALGYDLAPWLPDRSLARPCARRRETPHFPGTHLLANEWNSLFFWLPVEEPRFNHYAGGWPLDRRLVAMSSDARRLPYHPGEKAAVVGARSTADDADADRHYERIERGLESLLAPGDEFVVADQDEWRPASRLAPRGRPFPERDGSFTGSPPDDQTAIDEVERVRQQGIRLIAFVWPMLWWLTAYPDLRRYLHRRFRCVAESETIVAFDLQDPLADTDGRDDSLFAGMYDPDESGRGLPAPTGRLAEVLAEIASGRPEFVVQLGLDRWDLSVATVYAWPYSNLWGFGGDFEARERCRRLAQANGASADRVTVQNRCETSWLAAMAARRPVIIATRAQPFELLDPDVVPGLNGCALLVALGDGPQGEDALERFRCHEVELVEEGAQRDSGGGLCWAWLRPQQGALPELAVEDVLTDLAAESRDVRFLHIGSHDGVSDERLEDFIRGHGWQGVFVEPLPSLAAVLADNYRDVEGVELEISAVAEEDGERVFFEVRPGPDMPAWVTQISSLRKQVIIDHSDAVPGIEGCIVERRVPCVTVETLLAKHGIERLDLVVIDTEGYDYEILRQFDFDRLQPRVVIYEDKHLTDRDKHAAHEMLAAAGYDVRQSGLNDCVAILARPAAHALRTT